jgi:hypothetical protein
VLLRRLEVAAPMKEASVSGLDVVRVLLMVGFRIGATDGGVVAMQRAKCVLFVPATGDVSEPTLLVLTRAAGIDQAQLQALLARLRQRDTVPDGAECST